MMNIRTLKRLHAILAKVYPRLEWLYPYPLLLQVEITSACNLRCLMCERSYSSARAPQMTLSHLQSIVSQFPKPLPYLPGLLVVNMTGLGENLLNKDFVDMLDYVKGEILYLSFTSNFTLFDKEIARRVINAQVDSVIASIDGADKETFEAIRVGAEFERVLDNLRTLASLRDELGARKPTLAIRFVPTRLNIHQLPEMVRLASSLGVRDLRIPHFCTSDRTVYLTSKDSGSESPYKEALDIAQRLGVRLSVEGYRGIKVADCPRYSTSLYMTSGGYVLPCCFILQVGPYEEVVQKFNLGNIYHQSVQEIWTSARYREFRRNMRTGSITEMCKLCPVYEQ